MCFTRKMMAFSAKMLHCKQLVKEVAAPMLFTKAKVDAAVSGGFLWSI
jgi:hypothetical protein